MLIFIDESGDPGLKLKQGASKFFSVALVIFEDHEEALACDKKIEGLRQELGWSSKSEFHFKMNSDKVRETFLKAVSPYNFFYYGIIMNKKQLYGEGFKDKHSFYKYACSLVFENAKEKLKSATIIIDQSGSLTFKRQLEKYLKRKMNQYEKKLIKTVKMQDSNRNNLLQLADYVVGALNRSMFSNRKNAKRFRKLLSHREIHVQVWPKT
jgi:hypothetical protein